jgi:hemoglobin
MRNPFGRCPRLLALGVTVLALGTLRARDEPPKPDRKALDQRIYKAVVDVLNEGVRLHNGDPKRGIRPNPDACYRVYQAFLLGLDLVDLDHHPELQKEIPHALARASRAAEAERGFVLREVLDRVLETVKPTRAVAGTLWERLGGEANVRRVMVDFVTAAAGDPAVNFTRDGKYKVDVNQLVDRLVELVSAVSGGPLKYTGKDMKTVHEGMGITDEEFNALAGHLVAALKKHGAKPADVDAVVKAIDGTRKDIVEGRKPISLWDRLGGEKNVAKVVDDLVALAVADPKVDFTRGGKYKPDVSELKKQLIAFISSAAGGPVKYTGKDMKAAHEGMAITDEQFDALAGHLLAALKKHGAKPEDIDAVMKAVGGTRKDIVEK